MSVFFFQHNLTYIYKKKYINKKDKKKTLLVHYISVMHYFCNNIFIPYLHLYIVLYIINFIFMQALCVLLAVSDAILAYLFGYVKANIAEGYKLAILICCTLFTQFDGIASMNLYLYYLYYSFV